MKIGDRVRVACTENEGTILLLHQLKIPGNPAKMYTIQFDDGRKMKIFEHLLEPIESTEGK